MVPRVLLLTAVVSLAIIAAVALIPSGSPAGVVPAGAMTLTAYGRVAAFEPSSDPLTVEVAGAPAARVRALVAELSPPVSQLECAENSVVFIIAVTAPGHRASTWRAVDELCPVPGVLLVHDGARPVSRLRDSCALSAYVLGRFPAGTVTGSRSSLRYCRPG
jgi:hypothetical protein